MTAYVIFEVSWLIVISCGICYGISSHWNPGDGYGNLRRLAHGVVVFLVLLAAVVLEPEGNFKYYVSIISNSPFLLLVSINTILVLAFLSFGSVQWFVENYRYYSQTPTLCMWFVTGCINFLILDVYTLAQHCDHIEIGYLLGKVWSALVDYYCVSVGAIYAMYLLLLAVLGVCSLILMLIAYSEPYWSAVIVILGGSISSALTVWITYTVASSLGASTFIYMESVLRGYNLVILLLTVILVAIVWNMFKIIVAGDSTERCVGVLVVFTVVTTAAAVGVALDTPLPEQGADTAVPLQEQDATDNVQSSPCQEIDREDPHAIELGQLVHLHYLDQEGERGVVKVMEEVAGVWRSLGRHLECDVEQIAQNYVNGMHYSLNCCHEVLVRWFNKGGTTHYPLSWNGLVRVLEDIGLGRVADQIDTALKCVIAD